MQMEQLAVWLLYFYIYCFLGWVWESCYVSIKKKKPVNRGFMKGPLLPIYGSGAICVLLVTIPFRGNYILMAVIGMVSATLLEYLTGAAMEALFKVRYWDYSEEFMNLNGYVCLKSTLCWGVMTLAMVYGIHQPIAGLVDRLSHSMVYMLDLLITAAAAADFATSFKAAIDFRDVLIKAEKMKEEMKGIQERLDELEKQVAENSARTKEELVEFGVRKKAAILEFGERTKDALLGGTVKTKDALLEGTVKTKDALLSTMRKREQLQEELQDLLLRKLSYTESLRGGYSRSVLGLLRRNPGAVSKKNPEVREELKTALKGHQKKEK